MSPCSTATIEAPSTIDRFRGCLLGLALGDSLGAPHEGGVAEKLVWRVIGRTREGERRWTDDTQMALDLASSLVERGGVDQDDLAQRFAASYRWSRGYGPGAAKVLRRIRAGDRWEVATRTVHREGSLGNGGAMRAPAIGLFGVRRSRDLDRLASRTAAVTHAHPLGQEGAVLIARATAEAARGKSAHEILQAVERSVTLEPYRQRLAQISDLKTGSHMRVADVARPLGNGNHALDSCVTALFIALAHLDHPFDEVIWSAVALGGDVDTIAAMAGAIWGASNGVNALPAADLESLEARYDIDGLARDLHDVAMART